MISRLGKTDIYLPKFSCGTATFGNVYGEMDIDQMKKIVRKCILNGITLFDTSPYYGITKSETNLGIALDGIPRNKYFISIERGPLQSSAYSTAANAAGESKR